MKKLIIFCVVLGLLSITNYAAANPTYTEALSLMQVLDNSGSGSPLLHTYTHTYDGSVDPLVQGSLNGSAILTIVADDVDGIGGGFDGEQDTVRIKLDTGDWIEDLANLDDMGFWSNFAWEPGPGNSVSGEITTSVYDLGAIFGLTALEGGPHTLTIEIGIEPRWGAEIETSTLTIVSAIPAPGAILLGSIGVGLVGWLRRRRTL